MKRKLVRLSFLAIGTLLVIIALVPIASVEVPRWDIVVVDQTGKPVVGIKVNEYWRDYLVDESMSIATAVTDENGAVSFEERRVHASVGQRLFGAVWNVLSFGPHASFKTNAFIVVYGRSEKYATKSVGHPRAQENPTRVVLEDAIGN